MHMVFINKCKSCEISNQMFFTQEQKTNWLWHKHRKIKPFSGAISHGTSNEPEAYLEPSQTSMRECFCKNSQQLVAPS